MGSGYRTFTAGEVLTASNVQNYLQDQAVMVFGGSAARSSAIGTANFAEGMVSYLKDTDKVEAYNGTNWVSVAPTSTQGLTLINTTSFSGVSSVSLPASTFSATYKSYRIVMRATTSTAAFMQIRMRSAGTDNTTSNYYSGSVNGNTITGAVTGDPGGGVTNIMSRMGYANSANLLPVFYDVANPFESTITLISALQSRPDAVASSIAGFFQLTTSFDSASFIPSAGTITGNVSVYGYNE